MPVMTTTPPMHPTPVTPNRCLACFPAYSFCCCFCPSSVEPLWLSTAPGAQDERLARMRAAWQKKKGTYILQDVIEIDAPPEDVYEAVMTSRLWTSVYPNTLSTGGVTWRPFARGDLVYERFLFAGCIYSIFQYEVAEDRGDYALFHGRQAFTNPLIQGCVGPCLGNVHGSFEYWLDDLGSNRTRWTRNVYYYYTGGPWNGCVLYPYLCTVLRSQSFGADVYVQGVKRFVESPEWRHELFGPGEGAEYRAWKKAQRGGADRGETSGTSSGPAEPRKVKPGRMCRP